MKKSAWYNWTGDPMWDEYCKVSLIVVIIPGILILAAIAIGVLTGAIEVVA